MGTWEGGSKTNIVLNITLTYRYLYVEQRLVEFNMLKITAVITVLITPSLMFAQDLCDTLGALEADPKAVAPAVAFQDIQPTNLIAACAVAIDRADEGLPRFLLQRGRGYLHAGDGAAAMADIKWHRHSWRMAFLTAAPSDHTSRLPKRYPRMGQPNYSA